MSSDPVPESFPPSPSSSSHPQSIPSGNIVGLLALACFIPIVGPLVALSIGLKRRTQQGASWLIGCGAALPGIQLIIILLFLISLPYLHYKELKEKEAEVKSNLHAIQLAVELYATDNDGYYPKSFDLLLSEGYFGEPKLLPRNPFTKQRMRNIKPGEIPFEGEFTFEPILQGDRAVGYRLFAYGSDKTHSAISTEPGMEHVIIDVSTQSKAP